MRDGNDDDSLLSREENIQDSSVAETSTNDTRLQYSIEPGTSTGKPERRLFIKLMAAVVGSAYVAPNVAVAKASAQLSPTPVGLPFDFTLVVTNQLGTLSGESNATYSFNGQGHIHIDTDGTAVVTGSATTGTFVSGDNIGTITLNQTGTGTGTYIGTNLAVSIPILYSDATNINVPGIVHLTGTLVTGMADLDMNYACSCSEGSRGFFIGWSRSC